MDRLGGRGECEMGNGKACTQSCAYLRGVGCLKTSVILDQKTGEAKVQSPQGLLPGPVITPCVFSLIGPLQGQGIIFTCDKFSVNPFLWFLGPAVQA